MDCLTSKIICEPLKCCYNIKSVWGSGRAREIQPKKKKKEKNQKDRNIRLTFCSVCTFFEWLCNYHWLPAETVYFSKKPLTWEMTVPILYCHSSVSWSESSGRRRAREKGIRVPAVRRALTLMPPDTLSMSACHFRGQQHKKKSSLTYFHILQGFVQLPLQTNTNDENIVDFEVM